jgi:serine/threonine-protein kinase
MAPEQIEGQRGDQRTDVYALGTILYEMLSGKTPFTGDTNMAVMAQHLQKDAPRLDRINTAISLELAAVVSHCLARDPNKRYPDMLEFINGLDHPETVDLGILDKLDLASPGGSFWQSQAFRGVAIALAILAVFTILAMFLQALHK